jgi:hypothetical protein
MSQLLQVATRSGTIPVAAAATTHVDQGIPYTSTGAVAYENLGAIDHYHQGLPFTAGNRLAAALNGAVDSIQPGGIPITVDGLICLGTGVVDHYSAGIPYTATSQIKVN